MNVIYKFLITTMLFSAAVQAQEVVPEENAELLIWTDHDTVKFMEEAAKSFNKDFNVSVSISVSAVAPIDSVTRLIQDGGTTRVADVAEIEHDTLGRAVVAGSLIENLISEERIRTEFIEGAVSASVSEGLNYGFPVSFATTAMFYNKDILPEPPQSFEELIEFAPGFNDTTQHKYTLLWNVQDYYYTRMFFALFGAYEFGENGTKADDIGIASDEAVMGLEALNELKAVNFFRSADMTNPQIPRGLFNEGKVAAVLDGPWAVKSLTESGVNVGVVPMPTFKGQHPRTFSTVRLAVVSSFTEYPRAAQLFADYLASEKMLQLRHEMAGSIPPMTSLMEKIGETADPATRAIVQQGFYSDAMPSIPEMGFIWSPMASAIADMWNNDRAPREVLDNALTIVTEQLEFQ